MRKLKSAPLVAGIVLLAACAGPQKSQQVRVEQTPAVTAPALSQTTQESVVGTARKMLGAPYRYGGAGPSGFDCSGLVSYAYRSGGVQAPRTSSEQFRQSNRVPLQNLQPGDILFFRLSPLEVSHVGIYDRDGRFIHASSSGKQVSYASLDNPYWREHLIGAGRF
ncbi:C40 family peptidase [Malonomonas rubra]|uniref:C40 family peptidase n=1 Tax=Malonomonas rubra TaxID=57040 RepID=UPI0026EE350A|nr:C40 family peptidase [Malonomonas rubra]